jgi:hypothetical protein
LTKKSAENLQIVEEYEGKVGKKMHSSLKIHKLSLRQEVCKNLAPFWPFFGKFGKNSAASFAGPSDFLGGPFWVLRPKFQPLGNTVEN